MGDVDVVPPRSRCCDVIAGLIARRFRSRLYEIVIVTHADDLERVRQLVGTSNLLALAPWSDWQVKIR